MKTRPQQADADIFIDELEYLTGPIQDLYKTTKNARKYIISGLNSIDEQLKPITCAAFNKNLNSDKAIQYIDHVARYLQNMKREIERFQNLSDFEQNTLKTRIDFIKAKYRQLTREAQSANRKSYRDQCPLYHFPYSSDDRHLLDAVDAEAEEHKERESKSKDERERVYGRSSGARHYASLCLDRLLIDHLARHSQLETAYALVEEAQLTQLSNMRLFHKIREPLEALRARNPHVVIKWCRANKTLLKHGKTRSNLEFMAKSRVALQLMRNHVLQATDYIAHDMAKDLDFDFDDDDDGDEDDAVAQWRWQRIAELSTCALFAPAVFAESEAYQRLLRAKYRWLEAQAQAQQHKHNHNKRERDATAEREQYVKCRRAFKAEAKRKTPLLVYRQLFKAARYWKRMGREFWRVLERMYGLKAHSELEYAVSASLQTLMTPYCHHAEWAHDNCVTCKHGRNKMGAVASKSHLRGVELATSHIVCDRLADVDCRAGAVQGKEYDVIRHCMVDHEESLAIAANDQARVTPNGCVIDKQTAQVLVGTNRFIQKDYERVYLYYDLF